jgi:MFS superfamily sulfate permease-like transporter
LGGFLFYLTDILKNIPSVALSAIIIVAGIRLLRLREIIDTFNTRRASCYVSLATSGAVLITGLMTGILVAVALAIILVLSALARPHESIFKPKVPGLVVYRFAGPLFFLNAAYFANRVQEVIDSSPEPVRIFLINAEAIVDMDLNAAEVLEELQFSLKNQGITLAMCEVKGNFRKVLMTTHLPGRVDFVIYPSVAAAVRELTKEPSKEEEQS